MEQADYEIWIKLPSEVLHFEGWRTVSKPVMGASPVIAITGCFYNSCPVSQGLLQAAVINQ